MTDEQIIEKTIAFVKETLKDAEGGHDWFHIHRVFVNAQRIAEKEQVDCLIVALGALLHDIADAKFHNGDETVGPKVATKFLNSIYVKEDLIVHVVKIIENISYKSGLKSAASNNSKIFMSMEFQVVQDADRLDAIGAIGIARAFNYGGFKNRALYNPDIKPVLNMSKEVYKKSTAPTINHFYEKLLLLKNKMNTKTGKKLAESRHQYMLAFLEQFENEWNGSL
ncbi:MAG: HD domain-containing protein [Cellulophaga sp.]